MKIFILKNNKKELDFTLGKDLHGEGKIKYNFKF